MLFSGEKKSFALLLVMLAFVMLVFFAAFLAGRSSPNYSEVFLGEVPSNAAGGKISFSFSVHNSEGTDVSYTYAVFFVSEKMLEKTVLVENGSTKTFSESFGIPFPFEGLQKVSIKVFNPRQESVSEVFFWIGP